MTIDPTPSPASDAGQEQEHEYKYLWSISLNDHGYADHVTGPDVHGKPCDTKVSFVAGRAIEEREYRATLLSARLGEAVSLVRHMRALDDGMGCCCSELHGDERCWNFRADAFLSAAEEQGDG